VRGGVLIDRRGVAAAGVARVIAPRHGHLRAGDAGEPAHAVECLPGGVTALIGGGDPVAEGVEAVGGGAAIGGAGGEDLARGIETRLAALPAGIGHADLAAQRVVVNFRHRAGCGLIAIPIRAGFFAGVFRIQK